MSVLDQAYARTQFGLTLGQARGIVAAWLVCECGFTRTQARSFALSAIH